MSEAYRVDFGPDVVGDVARGDYFLTECIKAPNSGADPDAPGDPKHASFDGRRLVLALGPESTEDDTYSTVEVSSTRRFDQHILDKLHVEGSPRVVIPGRQAIFRDVVFGDEFADGRASRDPVTTGVCMQTWVNIEAGGIDFAGNAQFFIAAIAYIGGTGWLPRLFSRTMGLKRPFFASVIDFRVGAMYSTPIVMDPAVPHDIAMRWLPNHDVSFIVDGHEVAHYRDGKVRVYPLKLRARRYSKGTDLLGHRYVATDPCHIDSWINSSCMSTQPTVPNGLRFTQPLSVAMAGLGVEPL